MRNKHLVMAIITGGLSFAPLGCAVVRQRAPVAQGPGDAAAETAADAERRRVFAELTGGELGAGGGYLIGVPPDRTGGARSQEAINASRAAEQSPARPEDVHKSTTADLNGDGFVTLDEVIAMKRAGLNDGEIIRRLRSANELYRITPEQERYLTDRGMTGPVVQALEEMNHQPPATARVAGEQIAPTK
ncbi:MAG: hypothetical protein JWM97_2958 [Phycisphaerales bacterium]|nr:hypothetical protein [Phycisphaerales bacterium]